MVLVGVAAAVAVVAVIVAIVVATKGHNGGQPSGVAAASVLTTQATSTEPVVTESTPEESTETAPSIEASEVEQLLGQYEQDYSNKNAEGLEGLFAEDLERHDGSHAPEDRLAAVATYEHQFSELKHPTYSLSEINVEPGAGEASATAQYSITSQNGKVTGSITFHLVEQDESLLIDKLTIEPSNQ